METSQKFIVKTGVFSSSSSKDNIDGNKEERRQEKTKKEQEKGTDEDIEKFCRLNYGVTFPLAKKSSVIPGPEQNPVFQWLTDKNKNGWTSKKPSWNFSKYLVNEEGVLVNYFDPSISPTGKEVMDAIKK